MRGRWTEADYQSIIDLPHPESKTHPRMAAEKRAAQFAPFAALTGYGDAVRLTDERHEEAVAAEWQYEQEDYA